MTRTTITAFAALGFALVASGNAFASGEQADFQKCLTALQAETADASAAYEFKSMRGASLRRLSFEMNNGESTKDVVCKVKRGAVIDLDWNVG